MIHEEPIEYQDYVGSGYMLIYPDTGTGAYKISGGGNGGVWAQLLIIGIAFMVAGLILAGGGKSLLVRLFFLLV